MEWLIEQGVDFDQESNEEGDIKYHLTREGGHSHRRILHAADATGQAVQTTLVDRVLQHNRIRIFERYNAIDLVRDRNKKGKPCIGAYVWNRNTEKVERIFAKKTILATGGASKVYQYTSNPDIASGDGVAMAWRAGCRVANLSLIHI